MCFAAAMRGKSPCFSPPLLPGTALCMLLGLRTGAAPPVEGFRSGCPELLDDDMPKLKPASSFAGVSASSALVRVDMEKPDEPSFDGVFAPLPLLPGIQPVANLVSFFRGSSLAAICWWLAMYLCRLALQRQQFSEGREMYAGSMSRFPSMIAVEILPRLNMLRPGASSRWRV